jgi:hypothetical protein
MCRSLGAPLHPKRLKSCHLGTFAYTENSHAKDNAPECLVMFMWWRAGSNSNVAGLATRPDSDHVYCCPCQVAPIRFLPHCVLYRFLGCMRVDCVLLKHGSAH